MRDQSIYRNPIKYTKTKKTKGPMTQSYRRQRERVSSRDQGQHHMDAQGWTTASRLRSDSPTQIIINKYKTMHPERGMGGAL